MGVQGLCAQLALLHHCLSIVLKYWAGRAIHDHNGERALLEPEGVDPSIAADYVRLRLQLPGPERLLAEQSVSPILHNKDVFDRCKCRILA